MKKLLLIIGLFTGLTIGANAQSKPAEFKFEKETHDFGKVTIGTPVTYDFKFTNIGDEPLLITKAETTTGTVADFTQTPVKKGESGIVKITYNPADGPYFSRTIKLSSNSKTPLKTLYIKGQTVE